MFPENQFQVCYEKVRPTVFRLMKLYYIKLWETCDWEQEGMMVLYELLCRVPELVEDDEKLRIFFKTKFSNHINDELRKQESIKRQFNKLSYEDISELSHLVPSREMLLEDLVVFKDSLARAKEQLSSEEVVHIDELLSGRAFKGRIRLVRKLQELMS